MPSPAQHLPTKFLKDTGPRAELAQRAQGGGSQAGAGGEGRHRGAMSSRGRPASLFPFWFSGAHPPARPRRPAGGRLAGAPWRSGGRRGAPGTLTRAGGARRLRRTRGRSPPGPGAVAARLPALASPGRGPAAAAHGPPHPGTRARPAPGPTERGRRQGARASPPRAPGRPPALRAPRAGRAVARRGPEGSPKVCPAPAAWCPRGPGPPGTRPTHLRPQRPSAHLPAGRRRGAQAARPRRRWSRASPAPPAPVGLLRESKGTRGCTGSKML